MRIRFKIKDTLGLSTNLGIVNDDMDDNQAELECYELCLKGEEKKLYKTYADMLMALYNMVTTNKVGLNDYPEAEEKYRWALNE